MFFPWHKKQKQEEDKKKEAEIQAAKKEILQPAQKAASATKQAADALEEVNDITLAIFLAIGGSGKGNK